MTLDACIELGPQCLPYSELNFSSGYIGNIDYSQN